MQTSSTPLAARAAIGAHHTIPFTEVRAARRERILRVVAGALAAVATPLVLVGAAAAAAMS